MPATATNSASRPDESPAEPSTVVTGTQPAPVMEKRKAPVKAPRAVVPATDKGAKPVGVANMDAEVPAPAPKPDPLAEQLLAATKQRKRAERVVKTLKAELVALRAAVAEREQSQEHLESVPPPPPNEVPAPPIAKPSVTETRAIVRSVRRKRAIRLALRLAIFVVVPTALAAVYYLAIASEQFESHSAFTIHSADIRIPTGIESLIALGTGAGSMSADTLVVREYILSRDVLARLDKEHRFISHYKSRKIDWFSRLRSDASFEDAYEYYLDKVSAEFQTTSGTVVLRVRAFAPADAKRFADALMKYSEEKVNQLSERERRDRIDFAQAEVQLTESRLVTARQGLLKLQQEHGDINPLKSAEAAFTIKTQLAGELAKTQAELSAVQAYMMPDAPEVVQLRAKAAALSGQIAAENRKLVDPRKNDGVAEIFAAFESAAMEKEFAEKTYAAAITALELARTDATRQHRYLVALAEASLPDESTYPKEGQAIAGIGLLSLLGMGIISLIVAAVREHASI